MENIFDSALPPSFFRHTSEFSLFIPCVLHRPYSSLHSLAAPSFSILLSYSFFTPCLFLDLWVSLCPSLPPSSLLFLPLLNMFTLSQNNNANQQCNTSIWVEYCKDFLESYKINFNAKENERLLDPALKNRQLEYQIWCETCIVCPEKQRLFPRKKTGLYDFVLCLVLSKSPKSSPKLRPVHDPVYELHDGCRD